LAPKKIVGLVDDAVAVAIGSQAAARLVFLIPPHDVVGGVDQAVVVIVPLESQVSVCA
jgi:hypothetical protein